MSVSLIKLGFFNKNANTKKFKEFDRAIKLNRPVVPIKPNLNLHVLPPRKKQLVSPEVRRGMEIMGKIHSSHKNKLIDIPTKSGVISLGNI